MGGGKRNSLTVSLSPLGTEDTGRLVSELLSQAVLPAEVQATLIERSGGNPLYTEEFVKMLIDRAYSGAGAATVGHGTSPVTPKSPCPIRFRR